MKSIIRIGIWIVLLFPLASISQAKPVSRLFSQPCQQVVTAAKNIISEKPYRILGTAAIVPKGKTEEEDVTLIFETGSFWKGSRAQTIYADFESENSGCRVTVNAHYSGIFRNGTVFLNRLQEKINQ